MTGARRTIQESRFVKVVSSSIETTPTSYVVRLVLACGHVVTARFNRGRRWGQAIFDAGSLNRNKARRLAANKGSHCIACGPG
jgi:hypothetical protein